MSFTAQVVYSCINAFALVASVSTVQTDRTDAKIMSFAKSQHYVPAPMWIVSRALSVSRELRSYGFSELEAFCGNEGEVLISAVDGSFCLEVTVETNGTFTVSVEQGDARISFEEGLFFQEIDAKLREVVQQRWISSVGFAQTIGVPVVKGGPVLPLRTGQVLAAAHL